MMIKTDICIGLDLLLGYSSIYKLEGLVECLFSFTLCLSALSSIWGLHIHLRHFFPIGKACFLYLFFYSLYYLTVECCCFVSLKSPSSILHCIFFFVLQVLFTVNCLSSCAFLHVATSRCTLYVDTEPVTEWGGHEMSTL